MSTITVALPDEDFAFLRAYSAAHGMSAKALLAKQARTLREQLERPLHPEVAAAAGIIRGDVDGVAESKAHLDDKHR